MRQNGSQGKEDFNHGRGGHPGVHHQPAQEAARYRVQVPSSPCCEGNNGYTGAHSLPGPAGILASSTEREERVVLRCSRLHTRPGEGGGGHQVYL